MAYLTQADLEARLRSKTNLVSLAKKPVADYKPVDTPLDAVPEKRSPNVNTEVVTPFYTKQGNRKAMTPLGREMMGVAARVSGVDAAAIAFGVGSRTVTHALAGKNGSGKEVEGLRERIEERVQEVRELALGKMVVAMTGMTDEKFENQTAKELSVITSNLSRVVAATSKKEGPSSSAAVIFVTPEQKALGNYETVEV
jgi:hypothetical protein